MQMTNFGGKSMIRSGQFGMGSSSVSKYVAMFALSLSFLLILPSYGMAAGPYISVDVRTGRVIDHQDAFRKWYPASLTKVMTAYIVFREIKARRLSMKTDIVMSQFAAGKPASKMYFKPGTRFSVDSALKYLLVKSANDVAVAIAEHISGSEKNFVAYMNREAKRLGMVSTRFANPNGLPGGSQYTNARDMAVLALAVKKEFPRYQKYFSIEGFSAGGKRYTNYNLLLGRFPGANGMKTGFICASGFNLISSAKRSGRSVIAVVLGAKSQEARAERSAQLLQAGLSGQSTNQGLMNMAPYGSNRNQLANIRNQICTPEARAARYDGRDVEGKMVLNSPYIKPLRRQANISSAPFRAAISSGSTSAQMKLVPIPAPPPKR